MIIRPILVAAMENTYIVGSEATKECAVIDPGAESSRILAEVERLGLTVKAILNTHGHGDHVGAVAAIKEATGASYAIHQGDAEMLREDNSWMMRMVPDFRTPPEPDKFVAEGEGIEVGDGSLRVIETPGHTPGGVCYYVEGAVFTGDTLFQGSIGRSDFPGGNGRQLILSILNRLMTLPPDTRVYPGHGPSSTIGREKSSNPFLTGGRV